MLEINTRKIKKGIQVKFQGRNFNLKYFNGFWENYPAHMKDFLLDNLAFTCTAHLPTLFNEKFMILNTSLPLIKPWIEELLIYNIPYAADKENKSTSQMLVDFLNIEFNFKDSIAKIPNYDEQLDEKCVVNFSFGKESLLTFGLCRELGLDLDLVFFENPLVPIENKVKKKQARKISKLTNYDIIFLRNEPEALSDPSAFGLPDSEWSYLNQLTLYALEMLPINHARKSKFILFGNEKSCNGYYVNKEGYPSYPVFDQTTRWMVELNNITQLFTNKQVSIFSLVEPINELSVLKILHNRYSDLGQFQLSCFPDTEKNIHKQAWCHACSKCARIFVFLKALGIDVKDIGFKDNLFDKQYENIFPLFNKEIKSDVSYDASGLGKEEQMFAFYLATKRGESGYLIDMFKKKYLSEAQEKEDELHKEFFGVFDSKTMPKPIKNKVVSIFKEELNGSL